MSDDSYRHSNRFDSKTNVFLRPYLEKWPVDEVYTEEERKILASMLKLKTQKERIEFAKNNLTQYEAHQPWIRAAKLGYKPDIHKKGTQSYKVVNQIMKLLESRKEPIPSQWPEYYQKISLTLK